MKIKHIVENQNKEYLNIYLIPSPRGYEEENNERVIVDVGFTISNDTHRTGLVVGGFWFGRDDNVVPVTTRHFFIAFNKILSIPLENIRKLRLTPEHQLDVIRYIVTKKIRDQKTFPNMYTGFGHVTLKVEVNFELHEILNSINGMDPQKRIMDINYLIDIWDRENDYVRF